MFFIKKESKRKSKRKNGFLKILEKNFTGAAIIMLIILGSLYMMFEDFINKTSGFFADNYMWFVGAVIVACVLYIARQILYGFGDWKIHNNDIRKDTAEADIVEAKAAQENVKTEQMSAEVVQARAGVQITLADVEDKLAKVAQVRVETEGLQIENIGKVVEIEGKKALLPYIPRIAAKALEVGANLQLPGGMRIWSTNKHITDDNAGQLGPGDQAVERYVLSEMLPSRFQERNTARFIVQGGMGAGKTHLAKHVTDAAVQAVVEKRGGTVVVIDPHAPKTVWGDDRVLVVGAGMDYAAIRTFLDKLKVEIKRRYNQGCGDENNPLSGPPMFIICDEWTGIMGELQAKKQWDDTDIKMLYFDARKAGVGYFLVVHENTVGAMGIAGKGRSLEGVEYYIKLRGDKLKRDWSATITTSMTSFKKANRQTDEYDLITPGEYKGRTQYSKEQAEGELAKTSKYLSLPSPKGWVIDVNELKDTAAKTPVNKNISNEDLLIIMRNVIDEMGELNQAEVLRRANIQNKKRVRKLAEANGLI